MTDTTPAAQVQTESVTYTNSNAAADVSALRDKVASIAPNLIPEMLRGDSIASLMQSIDESRALFDRITAISTPHESKSAEDPKPKETPPEVPPGGTNFTDDLDTLPASELIRRGLMQRNKQA